MKLTPTKKKDTEPPPRYIVVAPCDAALWARCNKGTARGETWSGVVLRAQAASRRKQPVEIRWWKSTDKPTDNGGGLVEVVALRSAPASPTTRRKVVLS